MLDLRFWLVEMFPYIPYELAFLQTLAPLRQEWLNPFFIFLNHFDTAPFYVVVGLVGFSFVGPSFGRRLFYLIAMSISLTFLLKGIFLQPRPFVLDSTLGLITLKSQHGLPSGAAFCASCIAMLTSAHFKKSSICFGAWLYVGLIAFSRVYLGVHFISDVMVGIVLGIIVSKVLLASIASFESYLQKLSPKILLGVGALVLTLGHLLLTASAYQFALGLFMGGVLSTFVFQFQELNQALAKGNRLVLAGVSIATAIGLFMFRKHTKVVPIIELAAIMVIMASVYALLLAKLEARLTHKRIRL